MRFNYGKMQFALVFIYIYIDIYLYIRIFTKISCSPIFGFKFKKKKLLDEIVLKFTDHDKNYTFGDTSEFKLFSFSFSVSVFSKYCFLANFQYFSSICSIIVLQFVPVYFYFFMCLFLLLLLLFHYLFHSLSVFIHVFLMYKQMIFHSKTNKSHTKKTDTRNTNSVLYSRRFI